MPSRANTISDDEAPVQPGAFSSIFPPTDAHLAIVAEEIRRGNIAAIPTETVYGLVADATNESACKKVFAAKQRPYFDPLIVHVRNLEHAGQVAELNDAARALAEKFWPGPLTMVLPKKSIIPDLVTSGQPSIAIRSPAHPVFRKILELTGLPLAAPSANPFGYISPTTATHVASMFEKGTFPILDGGSCDVGIESTIVDLRHSPARILRPGKIQLDAISVVTALISENRETTSSDDSTVQAPGTFERHYSPHTPIQLHPFGALNRDVSSDSEKCALVYWNSETIPAPQRPNEFSLTCDGNPIEGARKLFDTLHTLDRGKWATIHIESAPPQGLGLSINDRLKRAAAR